MKKIDKICESIQSLINYKNGNPNSEDNELLFKLTDKINQLQDKIQDSLALKKTVNNKENTLLEDCILNKRKSVRKLIRSIPTLASKMCKPALTTENHVTLKKSKSLSYIKDLV